MHYSFGICFFNFFCWLYLKEQSSFSIWKPMFPSPRMLTGGSSKDVWPRWKWRSNRHKWREQRSGPRAWLGSDMCVSNVERGGWRQDEILHIVISSLSLSTNPSCFPSVSLNATICRFWHVLLFEPGLIFSLVRFNDGWCKPMLLTSWIEVCCSSICTIVSLPSTISTGVENTYLLHSSLLTAECDVWTVSPICRKYNLHVIFYF